jgi:ABC-2 type transport system permease protein
MKRLFFNFKITFKNVELIFWTFAFPIILVTLFYAAFSNITAADEYIAPKIAVIENEKSLLEPAYKQIFEKVDALDVSYEKNLDETKTKLENDEIVGIVTFENGNDFPKLMIENNGIDQTIIQNVLTEIELSIRSGKQFDEVSIKNTYERKQEMTMIEYFTLLAMACLYGAMISTKALDKNLANMTASGKRIAVSAVSKTKIVLGSLLTSYVTQLIGLTLLFLHMLFVLKIDFGEHLPGVILFTAVGALAGLALGTFVSAVFKVRDDAKDGITTGFTMLGCFFAGMMGPNVKFLVDSVAPFINKINPAAILTDGYYALTNFGAGERFWTDVISLLVFTAILSTVSILILRRQKYDNI